MGDIDFLVISATENSNKFQKTRFWKEKTVEDVVILGPLDQATLVNTGPCKLRHVSVNTKIICKVTLSLGLLSPPNPYLRGIHKVRKFY